MVARNLQKFAQLTDRQISSFVKPWFFKSFLIKKWTLPFQEDNFIQNLRNLIHA